MYTLFEVLTGKTIDSKYIYHESTLHRSITYYLNILLNTRQGSLPHIPDYGIPDLNIIYQGLPDSLTGFTKLLCRIIEHYEPRLSEVSVLHKSTNQLDCILNLEIKAKIEKYKDILLDTYFFSGGKVVIETEGNCY